MKKMQPDGIRNKYEEIQNAVAKFKIHMDIVKVRIDTRVNPITYSVRQINIKSSSRKK